MRVPAAAPTRLDAVEARAVRAAVESVIGGPEWILGAEVAAFEEEWGAYVGCPGHQVVGVGNGTDALAIALTALGLSAGAGVLVAADEGGYAATGARLTGLVPRVYDTGAEGPTVHDLEAAWHPGVEAVVVTHLHGSAVPLDEIRNLCRERGVMLVEDCAQAHGLRVGGVHVGLTGDAATFSFYPTKNLGAIGDGGAVVFARADHADVARRLRQYGWGERFRVTTPGGRNSRLDPLQAAVLRARLPFLDARNERRCRIAARYAEIVPLLAGAASVHHHAVAVLDDRDRIAAALEQEGVATAVHYPWLDTEMPGLGIAPISTPQASARRDRILSLPCFPEMREDEADHVVAALRKVMR